VAAPCLVAEQAEHADSQEHRGGGLGNRGDGPEQAVNFVFDAGGEL